MVISQFVYLQLIKTDTVSTFCYHEQYSCEATYISPSACLQELISLGYTHRGVRLLIFGVAK